MKKTEVNLLLGDCLDRMKELPDDSIDSIVTDPPYGLTFMGKAWDKSVPSVEVWQECLRVLKPGGHLLAFAGTRTQHRMAVNIEDAGFEIRDMLAWVYASGFPKSHDVSKAIDKAAGVERKVVSTRKLTGKARVLKGNNYDGGYEEKEITENYEITEPATPEAKYWEGWGTALKPALEPITLARKPFKGSIADNVLKHGTGAINIKECKIPHGDERFSKVSNGGTNKVYDDLSYRAGEEWNYSEDGRWPANLLHDGSDEVLHLFPYTGAGSIPASSSGLKSLFNGGNKHLTGVSKRFEPGSAARFFYCPKASGNDREEGLDDFEEEFKAAAEFRPNHMEKAEAGVGGNPFGRWNKVKNIHPTVKPTELMRYLCRLITPKGGMILDPFMGSGSTGKAAKLEKFNFTGIELDEKYYKIAEARINNVNVPGDLEDFFA